MFIRFDQEINQEAVLKTISVSGQGKKLPIRLATAEEIAKDSSISYYIKDSQPNRWLAFRAVNSDGLTENALPPASRNFGDGRKRNAVCRRTFDDDCGAEFFISNLQPSEIYRCLVRLEK